MMLFQAYFDDSGSHDKSQWKRFSEAWSAALAKYPPIDYLKMSEANILEGQFRSFTPSLRDQKVLELADVAEEFTVARICAIISRTDYNTYIASATHWREMSNPYFYLFYQAVTLTVDWMKRLGENTKMDVSDFEIDFIFDEQGRVGLDALEWWDVFKQALDDERLRFIASSPVFRSDRKILPLQAADLYAWHARHIFKGGDESTRTKAVVEVLKKVPPYGGMFTSEQMRQSLPELIAIGEKYFPR